MWIRYNPNPEATRVGDCTVRAISKVTGQTWQDTYVDLCIQGLIDRDMPSSNRVWGNYLKEKGFVRKPIEDDCNVKEFTQNHTDGVYVLSLNGHVVASESGNYFDTWDSGDELVICYWEKKI